MKKAKTLEYKLEKAIRLIWSRSTERRNVIKEQMNGEPERICPDCQRSWPVWGFDVDHEPPLGGLQRWQDVTDYIKRSFWGPQRLLCKTCHKKKTARQRSNRGKLVL